MFKKYLDYIQEQQRKMSPTRKLKLVMKRKKKTIMSEGVPVCFVIELLNNTIAVIMFFEK